MPTNNYILLYKLLFSSTVQRLRGGLQDISNSPVSLRTPDKDLDRHKDQVSDPITTDKHLPAPLPLSPRSDSTPAFPLDWTLKTKVRFVSPFPFSWTQSLRPQQEACGLTNFLTGSHQDKTVSICIFFANVYKYKLVVFLRSYSILTVCVLINLGVWVMWWSLTLCLILDW